MLSRTYGQHTKGVGWSGWAKRRGSAERGAARRMDTASIYEQLEISKTMGVGEVLADVVSIVGVCLHHCVGGTARALHDYSCLTKEYYIDSHTYDYIHRYCINIYVILWRLAKFCISYCIATVRLASCPHSARRIDLLLGYGNQKHGDCLSFKHSVLRTFNYVMHYSSNSR